MDKARNEMLTRVGRGTPMGELLRRYWHPIAGASELADNPIKAVRLMGEDLVLYQDLSGQYGLLGRHCPHRRADLSRSFPCGTNFRHPLPSAMNPAAYAAEMPGGVLVRRVEK